MTPLRSRDDAVRWGVIGTGQISETIVPDIRLAANSEAVAVCSRDPERAREFAARHDLASAYDDPARLCAAPDVDVVYIGTPHGTHLPLAREALAHGKHVVVEKPMALTTDEVRELTDAARRADRFLAEAMWMAFSPTVADLRDALRDGVIGVPRSVRASFGVPFPRGVGSRWNAATGGSALLDQGIYPVMLTRMILGEPDRVHAAGTWFAPDVDQTEWITLEYADGRFAQLASSMVEWIDLSATVAGTEGWATLDAPFWCGTSLSIHTGREDVLRGPERRTHTIVGNGYTPMVVSFSASILAGLREDPHHPLAETIATFRLLDRIRSELRAAADTTRRTP